MKTHIADFKKLDTFKNRFSLDTFEEGVIIHDFELDRDATIPVGTGAHPVRGAFRGNLNSNPDLGKKLGVALTDEVHLFNGDLIVQVFEGGTQLFSKIVNKSWYGWHRKRKPAATAPAEAVRKELKTKLSGPTKIGGFKREYEYTLYREGIVIRDIAANKEEIVYAGGPVSEKDGDFTGNFPFDRLSRSTGAPVSAPTKIFDGALRVVLCRRGFFLNQTGTTRNWNSSGPTEIIGDAEPVKAEPAKRTELVILDDELPAGAKMPSPPFPADVPWNFISKNEGPVHSGEKSAKLTAKGGQQNIFEKVNPGLRVGAGDVLFAYVYLDPKDPPEQIMLQWHTRDWSHRAYWGADKLSLGSPVKKSIGALPEAGKWVRLEVKMDDVRILPGAVIHGLAITQFGGTAYWDTIGINTATPLRQTPADTPGNPLKEHTGAIVACAISADGDRAVSIGKDKLLCEWDLKEAKLIRKFAVPESNAVAYLSDGKSVLLGTESESAGVWDLEKKVRAKELPGHQVPVHAVCVSPRGDKIWTADNSGQIRTWSVPDFDERGSISFENQAVAALALSPDGKVLACTGANGTVRFYSAQTGNVRGNHFDSSPGRALAFINNGNDLVVARDRGAMVIHLARPGAGGSGSKSLKLLTSVPTGNEQVWRTIYRPDGKVLLLLKKDSVTVVEGDTGKEIRDLGR